MNADAEFIELLKDEADMANSMLTAAKDLKIELGIGNALSRLNLCLKLLKQLGITYTPNSRKE